MNLQQGLWCLGVVIVLSLFSPSLLAQNCSNNQTPTANAGPDRSGNVGVALNFTGAGTDSDGTITAYWFNFGDGSFASWQSSPLASHSFASAGTFSVRLWVKDNCGAMSASDTAIITITQAPANPCANNTAPIANAGPDRAGNPNIPLLLTGYASTDVQNNISHYWWNFGDGQYTGWQSSAGISHAFANTGTYSVRLWVKDSCGAMSGADTVIVSIVNPNPCAGNTPPNAVITSPSSGLVNQSLNFSGLSSSDSTGTIQSYSWNFGDGQSGNGVNVSHSYASAGNKTVTLTLTDSCGAQGSMTRTIVISNPDPCVGNQPPIAQASANPANANINQSISFSAIGSSDPNGSITSYAWNFGDGLSGSGLNASHAYASAGSFNVVLTITDNCAVTATKTISVSITNPNQGLQANFKMYKLIQVNAQNGQETWEEIPLPNPNHPIELGLKIKFDGSSSTGESYYVWEFMDDGSGGSTDPLTSYTIHQCNTAGSFPVHLTVYNAEGSQSNTITKTIHVAQGIALMSVSSLPSSPTFFLKKAIVLKGEDQIPQMWFVSSTGSLAVSQPNEGTPSNPDEIVAVNLMPPGTAINMVRSVASYENVLYLADPSVGVRVIRTLGNTATQVDLLHTNQILGISATTADLVSIVGNALYVASWTTGTLYIFDVTNNPEHPVFVRSLAVPGGIRSMASSDLGFVATRAFGADSIQLIDARNSLDPGVPTAVMVGGAGALVMMDGEKIVSELWSGGTHLLHINVTGSSLTVAASGTLEIMVNFNCVMTRSRLYLLSNLDLKKFDITSVENPYLMDSFISPFTLGSGSLSESTSAFEIENPELLVGLSGAGVMHFRP